MNILEIIEIIKSFNFYITICVLNTYISSQNSISIGTYYLVTTQCPAVRINRRLMIVPAHLHSMAFSDPKPIRAM